MIDEESLAEESVKKYDPDDINNVSQAIDLLREASHKNREIHESCGKKSNSVAADVFEECALLLEEELLSENACPECGEETTLMIRFSDGEYENYCRQCGEWQDGI